MAGGRGAEPRERPTGPDVQLAGDNAYRGKTPVGAQPRVRCTRYLSSSPEFLRASAAGKLVLGADGLEQFNFYVTDQVRVPGLRADYAALAGLDQLETLRGRTKHYAFNTVSLQGTKLWDIPEQLPVKIPSRHRRALRLPMCAEPASAGLRLVVQVVTERDAPASGWGVSLNGAWPSFTAAETRDLLFPAGPYTQHVDENRAWNFTLDAAGLRDGWNEIALYNDAATELGRDCGGGRAVFPFVIFLTQAIPPRAEGQASRSLSRVLRRAGAGTAIGMFV